jgi:hypothetical protein
MLVVVVSWISLEVSILAQGMYIYVLYIYPILYLPPRFLFINQQRKTPLVLGDKCGRETGRVLLHGRRLKENQLAPTASTWTRIAPENPKFKTQVRWLHLNPWCRKSRCKAYFNILVTAIVVFADNHLKYCKKISFLPTEESVISE